MASTDDCEEEVQKFTLYNWKTFREEAVFVLILRPFWRILHHILAKIHATEHL